MQPAGRFFEDPKPPSVFDGYRYSTQRIDVPLSPGDQLLYDQCLDRLRLEGNIIGMEQVHACIPTTQDPFAPFRRPSSTDQSEPFEILGHSPWLVALFVIAWIIRLSYGSVRSKFPQLKSRLASWFTPLLLIIGAGMFVAGWQEGDSFETMVGAMMCMAGALRVSGVWPSRSS